MTSASLDFASDVCKFLGFDPGNVCSLDIHIGVDEPAKVTAVLLLEYEKGKFREVTQRYQIEVHPLLETP